MNRRHVFSALAATGLASLAPSANAQDAPAFAAPVRLEAGGSLLGEGRLYPSPVYQDVNGDGLLDIVVGDLRGHLTVAERKPGSGTPEFAPESKLKDVRGEDIDFHNW